MPCDDKGVSTWAHEARRSTGRYRHLVRRRKTKVRNKDVYISAQRRDKDVLWLQIPVVDSTRMAVIKCVDYLNEDTFDQLILSEECELPDHRVEVPGAEVVDEEGAVTTIDLAMESEDMGVG